MNELSNALETGAGNDLNPRFSRRQKTRMLILVGGVLLVLAAWAWVFMRIHPPVEPVFRLVLGEDKDSLASLLERRPGQTAKTMNGRTPLHYAVIHDNHETLVVLLEAGADIQAGDSLGNTPLHLAIICKRSAMVLKLLAAGASVDAQNHQQQTPLLLAAYTGLKGKALEALLANNPRELSDQRARAELLRFVENHDSPLARRLQPKQ